MHTQTTRVVLSIRIRARKLLPNVCQKSNQMTSMFALTRGLHVYVYKKRVKVVVDSLDMC